MQYVALIKAPLTFVQCKIKVNTNFEKCVHFPGNVNKRRCGVAFVGVSDNSEFVHYLHQ